MHSSSSNAFCFPLIFYSFFCFFSSTFFSHLFFSLFLLQSSKQNVSPLKFSIVQLIQLLFPVETIFSHFLDSVIQEFRLFSAHCWHIFVKQFAYSYKRKKEREREKKNNQKMWIQQNPFAWLLFSLFLSTDFFVPFFKHIFNSNLINAQKANTIMSWLLRGKDSWKSTWNCNGMINFWERKKFSGLNPLWWKDGNGCNHFTFNCQDNISFNPSTNNNNLHYHLFLFLFLLSLPFHLLSSSLL